jgi:3-dehydroquinate synthase
VTSLRFRFKAFETEAFITEELPAGEAVWRAKPSRALLVCDRNTEYLARRMAAGEAPAFCVLPPGEGAKTWGSVENILRAAREAGLGRDGLFVGCGGGVVSDLAAFSASVYMRGTELRLISTSLLGMVDAALGGKTGFDLFGIKNLAGTFYPASGVFAPVEALASLPEREWRSGMAELIKTALLDESGEMPALLRENREWLLSPAAACGKGSPVGGIIAGAMELKGRIVEEDPEERGSRRALLNLGHTFGHALESAAGLGVLSHGEAVAWGLARSADLGLRRGVLPEGRAEEIREMLAFWGYETRSPHPLLRDPGAFMAALGGDKKRKAGKNVFIVPGRRGAEALPLDLADSGEKKLIESIVFGT